MARGALRSPRLVLPQLEYTTFSSPASASVAAPHSCHALHWGKPAPRLACRPQTRCLRAAGMSR